MWQNTRVKWHPRWSDCWPAVVCNPIWWEMLVGGQSITSLMHNTACWKSIWDSKANFHVTWGFFFFFSAPIYRDIVVGFYWAPFIKISLKTFLEVKTPPLYTYVIWKMHFNHWWVNKVLWWRPNMVIVKIKKKLSDLGLRLLLCIIELSSFYFDWIVFWQRTKKNWSLKKLHMLKPPL